MTTGRRVVVVVGIALAVAGIVLARDCSRATPSLVLSLSGGLALGVAAAAAVVRHRRDTFAAPTVAFLVLLVPALAALVLWLIVGYSNCEPIALG